MSALQGPLQQLLPEDGASGGMHDCRKLHCLFSLKSVAGLPRPAQTGAAGVLFLSTQAMAPCAGGMRESSSTCYAAMRKG
jgi:hypothetical protein